MGRGIIIACKSCDFSESYNFGYGILSTRESKLFVCRNCGHLETNTQEQVTINGKNYESTVKCEKCNFDMKGYDKEEIQDLGLPTCCVCPTCGKHDLFVTEAVVLWD